MTGFGRGVAEHASVRATVDIRTVNHRFLDLKLRGAALPPALEEAVSTKVRGALERGSVAVSIHVAWEGSAAPGGSPSRIDAAAAMTAHRELSALAQQLGLAAPDLALVLAQPGVMQSGDRELDETVQTTVVTEALDAALAQLAKMRTREGAALQLELRSRFAELAAIRTSIATLAASLPMHLARRLTERVKRLLDDAEVGLAMRPEGVAGQLAPSRLAQEVALLADRADVTEELVRLASHLDHAASLIAGTAAAGRRLDFLVQEIGRELNTIGSKSALTEITAAVVDAKAALEKVREQIQNVE